MKTYKENIKILVILFLVLFLIAYIDLNADDKEIIDVKVIDKVSEKPLSNIRITVTRVKESIFYIKGETGILENVVYSNELGLASFVIEKNFDYYLVLDQIENKDYRFIGINKEDLEHNNKLIIVKM